MKTYNYLKCVKEDVRNYIEENKIVVTNENREEVEEELNDTLFTEDNVTVNSIVWSVVIYLEKRQSM